MLWLIFAATVSAALTAENLKMHDQALKTVNNTPNNVPSLTVSLNSAFEEVKSNRSSIRKSGSPGQEEARPHLDSAGSFTYEIDYECEESELDLPSEEPEDYELVFEPDSAFGEKFNHDLRKNIVSHLTTRSLSLLNFILLLLIGQVISRILN